MKTKSFKMWADEHANGISIMVAAFMVGVVVTLLTSYPVSDHRQTKANQEAIKAIQENMKARLEWFDAIGKDINGAKTDIGAIYKGIESHDRAIGQSAKVLMDHEVRLSSGGSGADE
ncbi:MAG: hypothetical protein GY847_14450 [Proteobacteria bacterium]|nr:hypothetical protein [Pseudomonadota bacterium]